jgi:quercetin dioxygenase-like cupin family protein
MVETARLDDLTERPAATAFDGEPRTVRLALDAGESVPEHSHPGATVLLIVQRGTLDVTVDGETHTLDAGGLIRFDGERPVAPTAREDSVAVVVLVDD